MDLLHKIEKKLQIHINTYENLDIEEIIVKDDIKNMRLEMNNFMNLISENEDNKYYVYKNIYMVYNVLNNLVYIYDKRFYIYYL